jgi:hypothetical protein
MHVHKYRKKDDLKRSDVLRRFVTLVLAVIKINKLSVNTPYILREIYDKNLLRGRIIC